MRRVVLLLACTIALAAAPAQATPSTPVEIEGTVLFSPSGASGSFSSTIPGCSGGTIQELGGVFVGFQSNRLVRIAVRHLFMCTSGGSFVLQLTVVLTETGSEFRWIVLSGTGAYAKLHGGGTGTGTALPGGAGIEDSYTGSVHFD